MLNYGLDSVYSSLHPTLKGDSPDAAFSTVPYEKGFQFLTFLESLIGEDSFQTFLQGYILDHSQTSVETNQFRKAWEDYVGATVNQSEVNRILAQVDWGTWMYAPGLPPQGHLNFSSENITKASDMADAYIAGAGQTSPDNKDDFINNYYSNLQVIFVERLSARFNETTTDILTRIDGDFNLTGTADPEIKQRWFPLGIKKSYAPVTEPAHNFVSSQGRLKYLNPIYLALLDAGQRATAVSYYCESKDFYHPMALVKL